MVYLEGKKIRKHVALLTSVRKNGTLAASYIIRRLTYRRRKNHHRTEKKRRRRRRRRKRASSLICTLLNVFSSIRLSLMASITQDETC